MFDPTLVKNAPLRVQKQSDTLLYRCALVRFHSSVSDVYVRKLAGNSFGFIPETRNAIWNFPVLQTFQAQEKDAVRVSPQNNIADGDICTVEFHREPRQDGDGVRNVVRVVRLPEDAQASKQPEYWLRAWQGRAEKISLVLAEPGAEWLDPVMLEYATNCRFAVQGRAENRGSLETDWPEFAVIGIAMSKKPIAIQVWRNGETETVEI